jgi:hypothetical protein
MASAATGRRRPNKGIASGKAGGAAFSVAATFAGGEFEMHMSLGFEGARCSVLRVIREGLLCAGEDVLFASVEHDLRL